MPNIPYNNFSATHIVANARKLLQEHNMKDYNISAVRLAEYCLKQPLYLVKNFNNEQISQYQTLINKRIQGIPLQHLLKRSHFRYLELESTPDVFIPRPETELIVDEVIKYVDELKTNSEIKIVDLCTGSANIAISVATEIQNSKVYAIELSNRAFEVAKRNNQKYGDKVQLLCDDATNTNWLDKIEPEVTKFDCVISNPPYIPDNRKFDDEVRFDPEMALYGGDHQGLKIPKKIVDVAANILKKEGFFIIEHDDTHQGELYDYIVSKGFSKVESLKDLNGYPRFIKAIFN